jgi:hypothetical protein
MPMRARSFREGGSRDGMLTKNGAHSFSVCFWSRVVEVVFVCFVLYLVVPGGKKLVLSVVVLLVVMVQFILLCQMHETNIIARGREERKKTERERARERGVENSRQIPVPHEEERRPD